METTLLLIKPDGVQRRLVGEILRRLEAKGLQIAALRMFRIRRAVAARQYAAHRGKPFYTGLVRYMSSAPVVAVAVRGRHAVQVVRAMMGATFGSKAAPGTVRGDLALSDGYNLVHGSDSPEAARRELKLYFRPSEVHRGLPADAAWVYDCSGGAPA